MVPISDQLLDVASSLLALGGVSFHLLGHWAPASSPASYWQRRRDIWARARQNWPLARPRLVRRLAASPFRWLVLFQLVTGVAYLLLLPHLGREVVFFDYLRAPVMALLYDAPLVVGLVAAMPRDDGGSDDNEGPRRPPFSPLPRRARPLPRPASLPRLRTRLRTRQHV